MVVVKKENLKRGEGRDIWTSAKSWVRVINYPNTLRVQGEENKMRKKYWSITTLQERWCKWQKNFTMCCGGARMPASINRIMNFDHESSGSPRYQCNITKTLERGLCMQYWAKSFAAIVMWWFSGVVLCCWYPGPRGVAFMIKFIILSVLACILTLPQHFVKNFCHLHRLSYYVVILWYFFCILSTSLCCGVIDFVAGIVHGALFDIFCFWACNSPYFVLIFLLP